MDFPILTALVVIPAVSALIVALLPARRPEVVRLFGLLAATLTGALSIALLVNFDRETSGFQFVKVPAGLSFQSQTCRSQWCSSAGRMGA